MDQVFEFVNNHPFLWVAYPILLVIPVTVMMLMAALFMLAKSRTVERSDQSNSSPSTSRNSRNSRKSTKSEQSDGDDNQKKKNKVRYLVRSGKSGSEDKSEPAVIAANSQESQKWNFPPILDDFNLMELDIDPSVIEDMFVDNRLIQVIVQLSAGQGLGLTIVGGTDSANGEAPIYVKRILGDSVLQKDGRLKAGDELVAVNDTLLVNVTKEYASNVLSNVQGEVRLLAIQDL